MDFSIIIPIFNERDNINPLNAEILSSIKSLEDNNSHKFEIIYVDDGSTDNSLEILKKLKNEVNTKIVKNKKNFSQSQSILNGIEVSSSENIILMDGDMQNDPKDLIKMIDIFSKDPKLVVHGARKERKDYYITKILPSKIANYLVRQFTNSKIKDHGCSLKIFNKNIINLENFFGDFHRLFAAQLDKSIEIVEVEVNHRARSYGKTNYGFERIFKVLVDLIFIRFINNDKSYFYTLGILGLTSFILSAISFIYMIYLKFFEGKSLIETPMPILTVFFALSGLIFFSIIVVIEALKKSIHQKFDNFKSYEIIKKE